MLRVLGATVDEFHRRGIPTLVFVVPANVEHWTKLGLHDAKGLEKTMDSVREIVTANGGRFLDLHATLPDSGFRDAPSHFVEGKDFDAGQLVARKLLPEVMGMLREQ